MITLQQFVDKWTGKKYDLFSFELSIGRKMLSLKLLLVSFSHFRMSIPKVISCARKKHKIINSVICNIVVNMVNYFFTVKKSSYTFFHNESVFGKIPLLSTVRMFGHINKPVAFSFNFIKSSSRPSYLRQVVAFFTTKYINMTIFLFRKFVSTLFTDKTIHKYYYSNMSILGQVAI